MKRLVISFAIALVMLFDLSPPAAIAATTKAVNTQKNQAEQISVVTTTPVALGGATIAESEVSTITKETLDITANPVLQPIGWAAPPAVNVLMTSGATYNTFTTVTMYNGLPALVSTTSTDSQGAANQQDDASSYSPANSARRDLRR